LGDKGEISSKHTVSFRARDCAAGNCTRRIWRGAFKHFLITEVIGSKAVDGTSLKLRGIFLLLPGAHPFNHPPNISPSIISKDHLTMPPFQWFKLGQ